jgi:hypothetical protein
MSNLQYTFFGGHDRQTFFVSVEVSSPDGNFDIFGKSYYRRYEFQNQNFDFETTKTSILHAWSIFFKVAHLTKLWSKKIFSMKTLSKLGALTVLPANHIVHNVKCQLYFAYS